MNTKNTTIFQNPEELKQWVRGLMKKGGLKISGKEQENYEKRLIQELLMRLGVVMIENLPEADRKQFFSLFQDVNPKDKQFFGKAQDFFKSRIKDVNVVIQKVLDEFSSEFLTALKGAK